MTDNVRPLKPSVAKPRGEGWRAELQTDARGQRAADARQRRDHPRSR